MPASTEGENWAPFRAGKRCEGSSPLQLAHKRPAGEALRIEALRRGWPYHFSALTYISVNYDHLNRFSASAKTPLNSALTSL